MGYIVQKVDTSRYKLRMLQSRANDGYNVNRKVVEVLQTGQWRGRRCFILGGGESLQKVDLSKLHGEHTIGINRSFELFPSHVLYMMDVRFELMLQNKQLDEYANDQVLKKFKEYRGVKVMLSPLNAHKYPGDVYVVRQKLTKELSVDLAQGIYGGTNSGFGAVQLAMCLGANPIYLLGFDMKVEGQTHWHSGYPQQQRQALRDRLERYVDEFTNFASHIDALGFNVVNLTEGSALKCFDCDRLESIL